MRCFYAPDSEFLQGAMVDLPPDIRRHIQTVLRLGHGQKIILFDGQGQVATCLLQDSGSVEVLCVAKAPVPECEITLIQGLPKGEKLEWVLQKGTELGVNRFILVPMQRSIGSLKKGRQDKKIARWQKIIQEAARQCRQFYVPELIVCFSFSAALEKSDAELNLLLWEESVQPLHQTLNATSPASAAIIVGPEGGVTQEEAVVATDKGFVSVSLGPRILRTETAGLAMVSVLQYRYGDMASGQKSSS
jgi:16S rRNA (uracil1498-N3)-methyltransferase